MQTDRGAAQQDFETPRECDKCKAWFDADCEGYRGEDCNLCESCYRDRQAEEEKEFGWMRAAVRAADGNHDCEFRLTEKGKQELRDAGRGHLIKEDE